MVLCVVLMLIDGSIKLGKTGLFGGQIGGEAESGVL
jgi:hypothetical protein